MNVFSVYCLATFVVKLCLVYVQVILKDLEDCKAHVTAVETLVSSSQSNKTQFERLYANWKQLYTAVRVREERDLN